MYGRLVNIIFLAASKTIVYRIVVGGAVSVLGRAVARVVVIVGK